jgi:RNA polymerase sigma factor (sigma-70 family)
MKMRKQTSRKNRDIDSDLTRRIQADDQKALEEMVRKYERFAWKKACKHLKRHPHLDIEDLCQEARIGVVDAAKKFDPQRNVSFMTYATHWVEHRINHYVYDCTKLIRVPINLRCQLFKRLENNMAPGPISESEADGLLAMQVTSVCLDANNEYGDGTVREIGDFDSGTNAEDALIDEIDRHRKSRRLAAALQKLPARERTILECRLIGLMTLEETALHLQKHGICANTLSRERIRQIQNETISFLHRFLNDK